DRGLERACVPEWDMPERPVRVRAEAVAVLGLRRETDDRRGASVEVAGADDDFGAVRGHALHAIGPFARALDRGLDSLGAGAHRQRPVHAGHLAELGEEWG